MPELLFDSDCDGIAYKLEPWIQAPRERLQQYARLRDANAGIAVYDGEWDGAKRDPTEADAWLQSIDQRPPAESKARQWDQTAEIW